jgi:2-oxoglutarate ferredoxin oxidoreductase subunit alpha
MMQSEPYEQIEQYLLGKLQGEVLQAFEQRLASEPDLMEEVAAFVARHDYLFVVEQNRDAQMRHLLIAEAGIAAEKLVPVTNYDGMPLTADFVKKAILQTLEQERKVAASCAPPITAASQA